MNPVCVHCGQPIYHRRRRVLGGGRRRFDSLWRSVWLHVGTHSEFCAGTTVAGRPAPEGASA